MSKRIWPCTGPLPVAAVRSPSLNIHEKIWSRCGSMWSSGRLPWTAKYADVEKMEDARSPCASSTAAWRNTRRTIAKLLRKKSKNHGLVVNARCEAASPAWPNFVL